jgi:hypothetical protein
MKETRTVSTTDLDGVSPEETFAMLGDETRLEIIRVLWTAGVAHEYDDVDDSAPTISFSDLRKRVAVRDNGRFNYHLSKLVPHFVRKTDTGYRLSGAGKRLARTVITVAGSHDTELTGAMETDCPVCGGTVTATYEDQWLRFACTDCPGLFGDAAPDGTLLNAPFPAPGLVGRTPDDALATELYRCMLDLSSMMRGICPECASTTRGSLSVCDEHDAAPDRLCQTCQTPFVAWGELRCDTCRFAKRLPVELCVMGLAPVIGFFAAQGTDVLAASLDDLAAAVRTQITTAVTADGVVVAIGTDDAMRLTLDDHLTVVDIAH